MGRPDYLTRDLNDAERFRLGSIVAALKPGVYLKCARCERFGQDEAIIYDGMDIICTECAS